MPSQSSIYSMISINDSIYIGGDFSSVDSLGSSFSNIVEYNTSTNTLQALKGGGLNGVVKTIISEVDGKT